MKKTFLLAVAFLTVAGGMTERSVYAQNQAVNGIWVPIGPEGGYIQSIVQHPTDANILYSLSGYYPSKLYKSIDKGVSWEKMHQFDGSANCFAINAKNPDSLYIGCYASFYKGRAGDAQWDYFYVENTNFYEITADPKHTNIIHACGYYWDQTNQIPVMAYMKSIDGGANWDSTLLVPGKQGYAYTIALDPLHTDTLYVGGVYDEPTTGSSVGRLFKSTNGGIDWSDITSTVNSTVLDIEIDPVETNKIYCITYAGIYRSTNGGGIWTVNTGWAYGYKLCINPHDRKTIYAGYSGSIFKSVDWGATWQYSSNGLYGGSCSEILTDASIATTIYFANNTGFFRSVDGGVQWQPSNSGLNCMYITSVKSSPSSSGTLFACSSGDAVYKTTNSLAKADASGIATWQRIDKFYSCSNLSDLEFDPVDPTVLYALESG
jgi:hypothetical protein